MTLDTTTNLWHDTPNTIHEQGDRPPAAGCPPPMRIPGAARRTPRHYPRLWTMCYYIVFFCFAICVTRYPPIQRPISREDAHRMYPRYPRVFLLFSFMLSYTAHSPTNLCESGWGYHCRVLVRLLALYAKLNWFFPKKPTTKIVSLIIYPFTTKHKYTTPTTKLFLF